MERRFRINELADVVHLALECTGRARSASRRVRSLPDARTIRYYTTLGLLDKPSEMRGRTAYYGRRHVLQLVAIKRLQASGMSLVDVQKALAAADTSWLEDVCELPEDFWTRQADTLPPDQVPQPDVDGQPSDGPDGVAVRRESFWAEPPAASPPAATGAAAAEVTGCTADMVQPTRALNLRLGTSVTITIEGFDRDRLDEHALSQLAPALEGLRAALIKIGVDEGVLPRPATKPSPERDGHSSSMS